MARKHNFQQASEELQNGNLDPGIWAMAYSQALGNETEAKAIYLRLRAEEIEREKLTSAVKSGGKAVANIWDSIGIAIGYVLGYGFLLLIGGAFVFGILDGIFGWSADQSPAQKPGDHEYCAQLGRIGPNAFTAKQEGRPLQSFLDMIDTGLSSESQKQAAAKEVVSVIYRDNSISSGDQAYSTVYSSCRR